MPEHRPLTHFPVRVNPDGRSKESRDANGKPKALSADEARQLFRKIAALSGVPTPAVSSEPLQPQPTPLNVPETPFQTALRESRERIEGQRAVGKEFQAPLGPPQPTPLNMPTTPFKRALEEPSLREMTPEQRERELDIALTRERERLQGYEPPPILPKPVSRALRFLGEKVIEPIERPFMALAAAGGEFLEYPQRTALGMETPTTRERRRLLGEGEGPLTSQIEATRETTDLPFGVMGALEEAARLPLYLFPYGQALKGAGRLGRAGGQLAKTTATKTAVAGAEAIIKRLPAETAEAYGPKLPKGAFGKPGVTTGAAPDPQGLVGKLAEVVRSAKRFTAPTAKAISKERGRRAAIIERVLAAKRGPEARRRAFEAAKGEIETPFFEPPAGAFTTKEAEGLQEMIRARFQNDAYLWMPTQTAFEKLFAGGRVPTARELQMLEEVFGPELIQAVLSKRKLGERAFELFLEVWNIPKALKASYDISAVLRQGAYLLMEGNAAREAFKAQIKAIRSEKGFNAVNEAIATNPWYLRAVDAGLDMTLPRQARGLIGREEPFIGARLAEKIPIVGIGVKLSQRAYTAFLNKMRMDVFTKYAKKLDATGGTVADFKKLASNINIMTGRGELGRFTEASMILNLPFFSPRFVASRFQLPLTLATRNPELAKMAVKDIIGYIGFMFTMLGLADAAGVGTVEWDIRSSDFGKLRIGNTRLDPFAGFQQPVVFLAQLLMGERKSVATGALQKVDPTQRVAQFVETKLAPTASSALALKRGRLYAGKELTPANFFYETLAPMPIGDVWEAAEDLGAPGGALFGAFGILGAGVQTFGMPDWKEDFKGYFAIPTDEIKLVKLEEKMGEDFLGNRSKYRKDNPDVDAKLFIVGGVGSVKTKQAYDLVIDLILENDIDPTRINVVRDYLEDEAIRKKEGLDPSKGGNRTERLIRLLADHPTPPTVPEPPGTLSIEEQRASFKRVAEAIGEE